MKNATYLCDLVCSIGVKNTWQQLKDVESSYVIALGVC